MEKLNELKRNVKKAIGYYHQRAIILMYHRIVDISSSPYHGIVSVSNFEQQMAYLHKACHVIPLADLPDAIHNQALPKKGVVITFDDGYADNYTYAHPILKKFEIPATIFITSKYIGSQKEFWWDELERIYLVDEPQSKDIPVNILGNEVIFQFSKLSTEQRRISLKALHSFLKPLKPSNRDAILAALGKHLGLQENGRKEYLPMSRDELVQISQDPLVQIGAHTQTHPMLSALSTQEQRAEITNSKHDIENITHKTVEHFAYPFGGAVDINEETVKIVQSSGFKTAVTTTQGYVDYYSQWATLPRIWVGNWNAEKFQRVVETQLI